MDNLFSEAWREIAERPEGPLAMRFYLQPLMATFFAIRDGLKDARSGRPAYFWAIFTDTANRSELLRDGWRSVGKIFGLAVVLDLIYQLIVLHGLRPVETIVVATSLAIVPYLVFRGPVNRIARRRATDSRIQDLVGYVRHFRESGVHERITDTGKDDIAILARALDAGFSAIASREQDRQQFLSIAAHEIRTPVTSIRGYASLLLSHDAEPSEVRRSLEVINRQSWRLSRLIESLFLAMQARSGDLHFVPKPFDMSALVQRVLHEIEPFLANKAFCSRVEKNISILGDEALLEHALWSLFACATALSSENGFIRVAFTTGQSANLTIDLEHTDIPIPQVQELFMPTRSVEYQTGAGIRARIGLYLCREIVRIHNGHLSAHQVSDGPEFSMQLPI